MQYALVQSYYFQNAPPKPTAKKQTKSSKK